MAKNKDTPKTPDNTLAVEDKKQIAKARKNERDRLRREEEKKKEEQEFPEYMNELD